MPDNGNIPPSPGARETRTDLIVGERVRRFRKSRDLTLQQVATQAGLSVGLVSQIERGLSSASVRVLARLADTLNISIGDLFEHRDEDRAERIVTRVSERGRLDLGETGLIKEWLTPFEQTPRLDLYLLTLAPEGSSGDDSYTHDGEEAGLVLDGFVELIVDANRFFLEKGDSFAFMSDRPHRFRNAGTREARIVWINCTETKPRPRLRA